MGLIISLSLRYIDVMVAHHPRTKSFKETQIHFHGRNLLSKCFFLFPFVFFLPSKKESQNQVRIRFFINDKSNNIHSPSSAPSAEVIIESEGAFQSLIV